MFFLLRSGICLGLVFYALSGTPDPGELRQKAQTLAIAAAPSAILLASQISQGRHGQGQRALRAHKEIIGRQSTNTLNPDDHKPVWRGKSAKAAQS